MRVECKRMFEREQGQGGREIEMHNTRKMGKRGRDKEKLSEIREGRKELDLGKRKERERESLARK